MILYKRKEMLNLYKKLALSGGRLLLHNLSITVWMDLFFHLEKQEGKSKMLA